MAGYREVLRASLEGPPTTPLLPLTGRKGYQEERYHTNLFYDYAKKAGITGRFDPFTAAFNHAVHSLEAGQGIETRGKQLGQQEHPKHRKCTPNGQESLREQVFRDLNSIPKICTDILITNTVISAKRTINNDAMHSRDYRWLA